MRHNYCYSVVCVLILLASASCSNSSSRTNEVSEKVSNGSEKPPSDVRLELEETDFHIAALECDVKKMDQMLRDGADPHERGPQGRTALHFAALNCNSEVIGWLLQQVNKVDARDEQKLTPLHIASMRCCDREDDPGAVGAVLALLSSGAQVSALDQFMRTPLHFAARYSWPDVIEVLLASGADIDAPDVDGNSPVDYAHRVEDHDRRISNLASLSR